ncbi:MAG: radical SAM protein [Spirochaetales bacterium]|nr:radical SAM protein [Spirochaetales bacterium]
MNDQGEMLHLYDSCTLCPRKCGVNRRKGERGFCRESDHLRIASACLHYGEEPVLSGTGGSGTVFFSGCTLQCVFCQNYQISHINTGSHVPEEDCARIFLTLQNRGAENINLVTGTHFIPGIISAIIRAREEGLTIPILWNSSGYEEEESLVLLSPYIDIWVPDIKTLQSGLSKRLCHRTDYPEKVKKALCFMEKQKNIIIEKDLMKSGMIVRHLVLPGESSSTKEVLAWYSQNLLSGTLLSLMFQYIPLCHGGSGEKQDFAGFVTREEYDAVLEYVDELGIEEGFIQDLVQENEWMPDFTKDNPFPSAYALPVWHFRSGFIDRQL